MADKCENCAEKCPQAERAHQAAIGRMYATNEFTALLRKVESGELVEVVRCKDCRYCDPEWKHCDHPMSTSIPIPRKPDDFCSYGERR